MSFGASIAVPQAISLSRCLSLFLSLTDCCPPVTLEPRPSYTRMLRTRRLCGAPPSGGRALQRRQIDAPEGCSRAPLGRRWGILASSVNPPPAHMAPSPSHIGPPPPRRRPAVRPSPVGSPNRPPRPVRRPPARRPPADPTRLSPVCPTVRMSARLSAHPSIRPSVLPSVHLSVRASVRPSVRRPLATLVHACRPPQAFVFLSPPPGRPRPLRRHTARAAAPKRL